MHLTIEQLESEALRLDIAARARLVQKLLLSLDDLSEEENERLWLREAEARRQELIAGDVQAVDGDTVMKNVAAKVS
jgi:hypothetical protein